MDKKILKTNIIFYVMLSIIIAIYTYFTVKTFGSVKGYIGDEVWYPTAAYNYLKILFHVTPPMYFPYSNEAGIQTYLNLSHPPLAKYIMDIFILLLGYSPIAWRLGSWIIGDLLLIAGFFYAKYVVGNDFIGNLAGLMTVIILASDPNLWLLHGIAMLDIYVAFFSFMSLFFLIRKRILLASIFLGLAFASKEPSFVLVLPFLYYLGELEKKPLKRGIYGLGIPAAIYLLASVPLIIHYGGIVQWLILKYQHMVAWDITNGHIALTAVSQISTPWGWFLNIHPFYMGYNFYANVNPIIMFLWLILTPFAFLLKNIKLIMTTIFAWTEWLGFTLVYFLGNHTLFSFYVTDFAPFVDSYVVISLFVIARSYLIENKNIQIFKKGLTNIKAKEEPQQKEDKNSSS
ncbi:glycosyltransferase [Acidianus sulfidivorans JP7]|uniref:Glycosyltransferase n=1 Tax=Acidianus sulfidivorans JP7 TaxID=619593 RepID=A0A2U9IKY2_9CREN|nr:glycosyltransferase family 39 protein [Acidianus sulfidivorans]AWR96708.1 glycosyltransferase [Acidianus sulfidivorans JP7]